MPTDRAGDEKQPGGLPSRQEALHHFATFDGPTQSQQHIKPLHRYVTTRLVLEGGFSPEELRPRPPINVVSRAWRKPFGLRAGRRREHRSYDTRLSAWPWSIRAWLALGGSWESLVGQSAAPVPRARYAMRTGG